MKDFGAGENFPLLTLGKPKLNAGQTPSSVLQFGAQLNPSVIINLNI